MSLISINRNPSLKQLNQFGFVWLGFVALFGAVAWFKLGAHAAAAALWIAAVIVPLVGWLVPGFMRLVFIGMSALAWPIGFVVSHVVLALVFYLVLTPIGLAMRLFGYDPMTRGRSRSGSSRWVPRPPDRSGPKRYFRQF